MTPYKIICCYTLSKALYNLTFPQKSHSFRIIILIAVAASASTSTLLDVDADADVDADVDADADTGVEVAQGMCMEYVSFGAVTLDPIRI